MGMDGLDSVRRCGTAAVRSRPHCGRPNEKPHQLTAVTWWVDGVTKAGSVSDPANLRVVATVQEGAEEDPGIRRRPEIVEIGVHGFHDISRQTRGMQRAAD